MTDNLRNFLKKVNKDKALAEKFSTLQNEENRDLVIQKTIEFAKEAGIQLTEADFAQPDGAMSDEEMTAVAGGWKKCVCVIGGGGKADQDGKACVCVADGMGAYQNDPALRCACCLGGYGND